MSFLSVSKIYSLKNIHNLANIRRSREPCKFICMACFVRSSREASDSRIRRAEHACKPDGLHGRGVNRISAVGKYRRSRQWHGMPRKEGTGARPVCTGEGGGEKVLRFRDKSVHFPPQEYDIALTNAIHGISWSSRKLLNLHKIL